VRRSLASRCFGTLLALWFAISIAEPQWLHACPMHNAPAGADAGAGAHGGHHAGTGTGDASHASPSGHSAHGAGATRDAASPAAHHADADVADTGALAAADVADAGTPAPSHDHAAAHCLCLGDCAPGVAVTLGTMPELPVATVVVIEPRGALPRADYVPVVRERTLPFATAPPAL
jgi:hypothetical protein